jgi:hypothetical protein
MDPHHLMNEFLEHTVCFFLSERAEQRGDGGDTRQQRGHAGGQRQIIDRHSAIRLQTPRG